MRKSQHLRSFLSMLLDTCHCLKGNGWSKEEEFQRKEIENEFKEFGGKGLVKEQRVGFGGTWQT